MIAAADLAASVDDWQRWLRHERRASRHTLAAYRRDLASFLTFLADHLGRPARLADLAGAGAGRFPRLAGRAQRDELQASSTARA